MKKLTFAVSAALSLALAACGGKPGEEFVGKLSKLKDEMCACKDKACAEKVSKEMSDWAEKASKTKASKEQEEEAMKIALEMASCQAKAMGAEGAGTP